MGLINAAIALAGTVVGFLLSRVGSLWDQRARDKQEQVGRQKRLAALLMLFLDEFVEAFSRCVMYYDQRCGGTSQSYSYSSIYQPTDSSTLAEFIRVCDDMSLHEPVFRLKAIFFQVTACLPKMADALHRSSKAPLEQTEPTVEFDGSTEISQAIKDVYVAELERMARLTDSYQGAVIAFFLGQANEVYPVVLDSMARVLSAARSSQWSDKNRLDLLETRFQEAQKSKVEIDLLRERSAKTRDVSPGRD